MNDPDVIFYTRKGCTLCDKAWPVVEAVCRELGLAVRTVDIDADPELRARHTDWVPVLEIGGRIRLRGKLDPAWVRRELEAHARLPAEARVLRVRIGVAVVFDDRGRMLVNRRPEGTYYGGWWEWPGGKCEPGEHPLACSRRELTEEIGISALDWRLFDRREAEYPGRKLKLWFYTAHWDGVSQPRADALEHRWLPARDVRALNFLEPNLPVLERLTELGTGQQAPTTTI